MNDLFVVLQIGVQQISTTDSTVMASLREREVGVDRASTLSEKSKIRLSSINLASLIASIVLNQEY